MPSGSGTLRSDESIGQIRMKGLLNSDIVTATTGVSYVGKRWRERERERERDREREREIPPPVASTADP